MVHGCVRSTLLASRGSNYGRGVSTAIYGMTSSDKSEWPARCLHVCGLVCGCVDVCMHLFRLFWCMCTR